MTTGTTTLLGLALPVQGELSGTWGDTVNNSITSLVDSAIAGTTTLSTDADVTLTTTTLAANQARQAIILWTASGTATRTITVPAWSKPYIVINKTGSTQSIIVIGTSGTGVTLVAGEKAVVAWDGANFVKVSSTVITNLTGTVSAANGGTGVANNAASTITISGAYGTTFTVSGTTALTLPTSGTLLTTAGSGSSLTFGTGLLSLAGNLTTSGAYATTVTVTAATAVTLPTSGTLGYQNIPQNSQSAAYTTVAADAGKCIFHPASDANARTFTIDSNANVPYALGTVIQFINMSSSNVTISITSDTLTWAQGGGTGSRTLAQYGVANCTKIGTTQWLLTGTNVT